MKELKQYLLKFNGDEKMINKEIFPVAILTPYLTEELDQKTREFLVDGEIGYQSNNFSKNKELETEKWAISLLKPEYVGGLLRTKNSNLPLLSRLVIAGSTVPGEEEVIDLKGSGLIVARYSMFFNGPSRYTGRMPEESGYSLDIPKSVSTVREMLSNDEVLDALVAREETQIRKAIGKLNKILEEPILVTSYLREALNN
jgi:hypothetical protein